jgi:preprotein translocase subunit SecG
MDDNKKPIVFEPLRIKSIISVDMVGQRTMENVLSHFTVIVIIYWLQIAKIKIISYNNVYW